MHFINGKEEREVEVLGENCLHQQSGKRIHSSNFFLAQIKEAPPSFVLSHIFKVQSISHYLYKL